MVQPGLRLRPIVTAEAGALGLPFENRALVVLEGGCRRHTSREEAERTLVGILRDEPDWEGDVWVEPVELGEPSPN